MVTKPRLGSILRPLGIAVTLAAAALPAPARAAVAPYGANDFGYFNDVLPPGANGLVTLPQALAFVATGARPPHNDDQLGMYNSLTTAAPGITQQQIPSFFKDATFGVKPGNIDRTETPEPGVTIEWDASFGVPHIYGATRAALMFGIGWATAEDRLFFIDALRHAGRGQLASFAGGSNAAMDESVWANEPYTPQDLANQVAWARTHLPGGAQVFADAQSYVNGINAYIARASDPIFAATMMPAEYQVLGITPQPFTVQDVVAIATLVGGIFGGGGGAQLQNAVLYEDLHRRFGPERFNIAGSPELVARPAAPAPSAAHPDRSGFGTFLSFDDPSDPEAPTTVARARFPYQTLPVPSAAVQRTIALPDPGSVRYVAHVAAGALPSAADIAAESATTSAPVQLSRPLLTLPREMSNALLISARESAGGHPLAVMGPQVSYYTPQILMEEDIHGPGIDAAGAAFAGANLYVQLGHGTDYAWSATSSGQNIIDTFAVALCRPGGGRASTSSDYYVLRGRCTKMQTLTDHESWSPNLADPTPAGSVTFRTQRTAFGIVIARATVRGRPVAYCNLRSTYLHELDSAVGFAAFNDPARMRTPAGFFQAANEIGYTFNWFYANPRHIAYFNSGRNPVRAPSTDPLFPSWSAYTWPGYTPAPRLTPATLNELDTPQAAHPHTVDQAFLTSWNNKQAPAYNDAATRNEFASVYRSQLLDLNIERYLRAGKLTLAQLIDAMGSAGTQDLRGVEVLPYALRIIGRPSGPPLLANALAQLRVWIATGAHRINRAAPGASGTYEQGAAIRIADAWWPRLVSAEFTPVLGAALVAAVEREFRINDQPGGGASDSHLGSAFDAGFYGIVQKDLRAVLGLPERGRLNRVYCGDGSLARCRAALERSLEQAAAEPATSVYPAQPGCSAGDQMCADAIRFHAIGAITQPSIEWVNRPTFQQADELTGRPPG